jgi:hypothetical protein
MHLCFQWTRVSLLLVVTGVLAWSQTDRAGITGTVTDPNGSPVPAAKITATSLATGLQRSAITTDAGAYTMTALPIGMWTVSIAARGFETVQVARFELQVGQTRTIDAQMTVGSLQSKVVQTSATVGA